MIQMDTEMNAVGNKWVLVTGSGRGIGRAIALRAARDGFNVVVHCHSRLDLARKTVDESAAHGVAVRLLQFDLRDRQQTQQVLTNDIEQNGAYYGVVCNAGIIRDAAFPAMKDDEWDSVIQTNLSGLYNVLKPVVMPMVRQRTGRIVTIASVSGLIGNRGQVNYSAAKGGVIAATKSLALELAKRQITVNCVAPGLIETEMLQDVAIEEALKHVPLRRVGTAEDVAGAVSYLLSPDASYVTRQVISVNGGVA